MRTGSRLLSTAGLSACAVLTAALVLGGVARSPAAEAQQSDKVARVGYLSLNAATGDPRPREAFHQGLRDLGYVEGRNLHIEYRDAQGNPDRFPALASELVARKVDVIVTGGGTLGAIAAKQATVTTTIPVVFTAVGDPVAEGLVASLARPAGNVTGLAVASPELISKSLEVLKQALPEVTRVALLVKPDAMPERVFKERMKAAEVTAQGLGLRLSIIEARGPADFDRAFAGMSQARVSALTVLATPVFDSERRRLVELTARHRLPAVYSFRGYVEAGGLMSYGPDLADLFRRAATYVDKILKGAKPGDLPVEQPTKFELVVNLKTVRALKLTLPPSFVQRADQVFE